MSQKKELIAIVGMACQFPGAQNYQEFWANLANKTNSITEIPRDRWDWRNYAGDPNTGYHSISQWGGIYR